MSIKSLFEDVADAIREKSGSSDTYTPAEMPSAIRSIPSGSSTASGVSYDNTSSGLTASNVQDAIDELSGDLSTINSDLSELVVVEKVPLPTASISANAVYEYNVDTSKNGYTPVGIVGYFPDNTYILLVSGKIRDNSTYADIMVYNRASSSYNGYKAISVLYIKNMI